MDVNKRLLGSTDWKLYLSKIHYEKSDFNEKK